jgi:hypothetical protein
MSQIQHGTTDFSLLSFKGCTNSSSPFIWFHRAMARLTSHEARQEVLFAKIWGFVSQKFGHCLLTWDRKTHIRTDAIRASFSKLSLHVVLVAWNSNALLFSTCFRAHYGKSWINHGSTLTPVLLWTGSKKQIFGRHSRTIDHYMHVPVDDRR